MKHFYNLSSAANTLQSTTLALGTALSGKIISLLFVTAFLLVSGVSMGQIGTPPGQGGTPPGQGGDNPGNGGGTGGTGQAGTITSINPTCGVVGQEVLVTGTDFKEGEGQVQVGAFLTSSSNQPLATVVETAVSSTEVRFILPASFVGDESSIWIRVYNKNNGDNAFNHRSNSFQLDVAPPNLGAIAGPSTNCVGSQGVAFEVPAIAGSEYVWTVPEGAVIASGQNTNQITVDFPQVLTGTVSVTASNACGTDTESLSVSVTSQIIASGYINPLNEVAYGSAARFEAISNINDNGHDLFYRWYMRGSEGYVLIGASGENTVEVSEIPADYSGIMVEIDIATNTCYDVGSMYTLTNESITPLPVELISFNAQRHTQGVNLAWVTASELDNKGFEVQVSTDSKNFTAIGFVESKVGSTSLKQYYNFLDTKAVSGTRYYRLKQIDFDGTSAYSNIRSVSLNGNNGVIAAYPNPFEDVVTVTLNGTEARSVHVILTNAMGKVVLERMEETSGNSISVDMAKVTTKGMYMLHVMDNGSKHVFKMMKR